MGSLVADFVSPRYDIRIDLEYGVLCSLKGNEGVDSKRGLEPPSSTSNAIGVMTRGSLDPCLGLPSWEFDELN